jgi:hypothetical protein
MKRKANWRRLLFFGFPFLFLTTFLMYSENTIPIKKPITLIGPSNLRTTEISPFIIRLTWNDVYKGAAETHIEKKTAKEGIFREIAVIPKRQPAYFSATGLNQGATYGFRVRNLIDSVYTIYSNEIQVTTPPKLNATKISDHEISLDWWANQSDHDGFVIFVMGDYPGSVSYRKMDTLKTCSKQLDHWIYSLNVGGYTPACKMKFKIQGYKESNYFTFSNDCEVNMSTPVAPQNLRIVRDSSVEVSLTWRAFIFENVEGYIVERKTESGDWTEVKRINFVVDMTVNPAKVTMNYEPNTGVVLDKDYVTFHDFGLTANTKYYYRLIAFNKAGFSPSSAVVSATTY